MPTVLWNVLQGALGGLISGALVVPVVFRWFGDFLLARLATKQKAKYDRGLEELKAGYSRELEALKAELDKSVFVTRAQFETEFEAYKQIAEALAPVRLAMASTRPMYSIGRADETRDDKFKQLAGRLSDLIDAQNKAVRVVENFSFFYPREIYACIVNICLKASALEINDIRKAGEQSFTSGWFDQGFERNNQFLDAYEAVSTMIRDRIARLAIIPIR